MRQWASGVYETRQLPREIVLSRVQARYYYFERLNDPTDFHTKSHARILGISSYTVCGTQLTIISITSHESYSLRSYL